MKYVISKSDGTPIDPKAKYFVLRLDDSTRPDNKACRAALQVYCQEVFDIDMEAFKAASDLLAQTRKKKVKNLMTIREIADLIHGREYTNEFTDEILKLLKDNRLCAVVGAGDDNVEIHGYWREEIGACGGAVVKMNKGGLIQNLCDHDRCPYYEKQVREAKNEINAIWNESGYSWFIDANFPYISFDIMEDGEAFCRGIVFSIDDLK